MPGKVYLVGAGPGAPDLLSLRAARILGCADIVFTDALVHADTLALACKAKIVYAGKRAGRVSTEQRFINRAMVAAARRHAVVVRLKGGDPMLFGRAQEEIDALREAGIAFEVVPGISAAFAAAASLETSLTQRGIARSVTFATPRVGHGMEADGAWADALTSGASAALYMAAGQADSIVAALLARGFSPDSACAVVVNASLAEERTSCATLAELPEMVRELPAGPALVLIGDIVQRAQSRPARTRPPSGASDTAAPRPPTRGVSLASAPNRARRSRP